MKYFLIFILIISYSPAFCQPTIESKIKRIENGLTQEIFSFDSSTINRMNIAERMKYHKVNGVSIAVIENGEIQWTKAYGLSDASTGEKVLTESLFQTASIGKVITALAALKLVRDGKITLEEDINSRLTSFKIAENKFTIKEKVTLRRLLCHSAGFTDDYGFAGYSVTDSIPTLLNILKAQPPANNTKALKVNYVPGSLMRYSGAGYLVIQQLIEDLSGTSFTNYVEKEIFSKLHLTLSTYNYFPDQNGFTIARGHDENGNTDAKEKYHVYPESAAAGFWTTPGDLAKILIEMQQEYNGISDKILNQPLLDSMLTPQFEFNDRGLGAALIGAERVDGFWHAGQNAGYNSLMYATTKTGQGAVVMLNSDGDIDLATEIMRSIANENKWPFMQTKLVTKEPADTMQIRVGNYRSKEGVNWNISQKENDLILRYKDLSQKRVSSPLSLYRVKNGHYILAIEPDTLDLEFSQGNELKKFILSKYGGTKMLLEQIQ
ncbi:MAG: serine hydrolase domain-containing protein [Ferruginibacter sp.]